MQDKFNIRKTFVCLFLFCFVLGCVGAASLLCTGFLQLRREGATLCCCAWASRCSDFSCCGAQAPGSRASVVAARRLSSCGSQALECRLSSCGAQAQLPRGRWDLLRPVLKSVSPALADGFLTTAPPGKPRKSFKVIDFINTLKGEYFVNRCKNIKFSHHVQ